MEKTIPEIKTRKAEGLSEVQKDLYADTLHCNRCGFCTSFCPTYLATGDEALSPRGRNQTFRALLEGRVQDAAAAQKSVDTCLLCGICTSVCFAEVPTAHLMSHAREELAARRGAPFFRRFFLRQILPRPFLFEMFLKIGFLIKKTKIPRLLNRAGILKFFSKELAAAEAIVDDVSLSFLRGRLARPVAPGVDPDVIQFLACGPNYIRPSVGMATNRLLKKSGQKSACLSNFCCGLPGVSMGDFEAARALAKKTIVFYENFPKAAILVDDSSCAAMLKDYPALFTADAGPDAAAWKVRAEALVRRVRDINEWLIEVQETLRKNAARAPIKVTYHDACKARYGQKIVSQPREILAAWPGVAYHELPEADQCCGGGGTYSFLQPEISQGVLDRKTQNLVSTQAQVVLTSSVSCLIQVASGLKKSGAHLKALHIAEFLAGDL